jgi:N-acetylmuramoyl-L-alanine amidase
MKNRRKAKRNTPEELMKRGLAFSKKITILRKVIAKHIAFASVLKNIRFGLVWIAITLLLFSATEKKVRLTVDTVVIDAGHGGKDPGTAGRIAKEKDVALKIALKAGAYIEKNLPDVKVIYTRKTDRYLEIDQRSRIANQNKADLFICIHANANTNARVFGTETYVMGLAKEGRNFDVAKRENEVILLDENYQERYEGFDPTSPESYILFSLSQNAFLENSLNFADKVESQFKNRAGRASRGVKQGPFWVLWSTAMPSVLIETGFLSNPEEEEYLASEHGQDLLASAIYRAFKEYKTQMESIQ